MPIKLCNTENMKKFVDALRSGDFQQGQNALERTGENGKAVNCCLGVACRVAIKDGLALATTYAGSTTHFGEESAFLPQAVKDWLGVATTNPIVKGIDPNSESEDQVEELLTATYLNDSGNYTFTQIADAFERTYLTE